MDYRHIHTGKALIRTHAESCAEAVRFLTILPLSFGQNRPERNFSRALYYFSPVGSLIGISLLLIVRGTFFFNETVTAAILVVLMSLVSGFLHLDGLADTADGFMSHQKREDCLTIMKDSRIGVMGAALLLSVFLLKFSVLAGFERDEMASAVFIAPVAGRTAITVVMALLPYARAEGGLGSLFYSRKTRKAALINLLYFSTVVCLFGWEISGTVFLSTASTVILIAMISKKKLVVQRVIFLGRSAS